jgi:hypothetical protein
MHKASDPTRNLPTTTTNLNQLIEFTAVKKYLWFEVLWASNENLSARLVSPN